MLVCFLLYVLPTNQRKPEILQKRRELLQTKADFICTKRLCWHLEEGNYRCFNHQSLASHIHTFHPLPSNHKPTTETHQYIDTYYRAVGCKEFVVLMVYMIRTSTNMQENTLDCTEVCIFLFSHRHLMRLTFSLTALLFVFSKKKKKKNTHTQHIHSQLTNPAHPPTRTNTDALALPFPSLVSNSCSCCSSSQCCLLQTIPQYLSVC